jgi:hypothetical protein
MATPIEGTHQHARSGRVYTYRADYRTEGDNIRWQAEVRREDEVRLQPRGEIRAGTPAAAAIAEAAVTDQVVKAIDGIEDDSGTD